MTDDTTELAFDSANPLSTGMGFVIGILMTLVLTRYVAGVTELFFDGPLGLARPVVSTAVLIVVTASLAHLVHSTFEDYLWTKGRNDPSPRP